MTGSGAMDEEYLHAIAANLPAKNPKKPEERREAIAELKQHAERLGYEVRIDSAGNMEIVS